MKNKEYAYNILSKIQADNFAVGKLFQNPSTVFYDHNESTSSFLYWRNDYYTDVSEIINENNIKVIHVKNNTGRMYSNNVFSSNFKSTNFQVEFELLIPSIKSNNIYFTFYINNNQLIKFNIQPNALSISCNNKTIKAGFKFKSNIKYNLLVTKENNLYSFMVDGIYIGYIDSPDFTNNINVTGSSAAGIIANSHPYDIKDDSFIGYIYNINISEGQYLKYYNQYSKYSANLVSYLNINSTNITGSNIIATNIEAIPNSNIWEYTDLKLSNSYITDTLFSANINTNFTVSFVINSNKKDTPSIDLVNINDIYKVIYTNVYKYDTIDAIDVEPDVIVNEYTTAALNFENGLVDQIGTTVWTKEGTSDITSVNKIFGENSFETKALGDSLSTTSKLITGGTTPFTIEFYALVNASFSANNNFFGAGYALLSQNRGGGDSDQQILVDANLIAYLYRGANGGASPFQLTRGSYKNLRNELNKYTFTYDGSALRLFINDQLDIIVGTNNGWDVTNPYPFTFFDNLVSGYSQYRVGTKGIIDNINIHDGIATKVRDHDPYEEFLVVDLAFDGENNSTKIVDNGSLKSNWLVKFNNPSLKTSDSFNNKSALYLNGNQNIKSDIDISFNSIEDFTFSFEFMRIPTSQQYIVLISTNTDSYQTSTDVFSINAFTNNYTNVTASYLRNKLSFIDEKNFENDATNSLISKTNILDNVKYKIDIVRKSKITYLYINNILDTQSNIFSDRAINFGKLCIGHCAWSENSGYAVGLNGYIKNFKIYKDAAVIPEDPTGKIQLDFDNNVIDKYGNSTWTNNGVTFDQANSVKGYAAKLSTSSTITSTSSDLNFENKGFDLSYDIKSFDVSSTPRYAITNNINYSNSSSIWLACSNYLGFDYFDKPANSGAANIDNIITNTYYNQSINRRNDAIFIKYNDVLCGTHNLTNQTFNFISGGNIAIGRSSNFGIGESFNGVIDNFKSIKNPQEQVVIDKPAVHLPLETNATNIGFTPLTINSVGNPTYTTIDGKKCIKFESGKYLTINTSNIFNLGTNSDFYIEFDFFVLTQGNKYEALIADYNTVWRDSPFILSILNADPINNTVYDGHIYFRNAVADINNILITKNTIIRNNWNNLKFYRSNTQIYIVLNDVITESNFNVPIIFNKFTLGDNGWNQNGYLDGYMSNFKMFVGTSEIPETYNDKKVLSLDFKPTGKSYLFKDNNNKCVIHPVNITQRDYQDSQYCCTFNGTNQYLQLGKNDLFNFGLDDFVIYFKVRIDNITPSNKDDILLSNNISWAAGYIGIGRYRQTNKLSIGAYGTPGYNSSNTFNLGINDIIITRNGSNLTINLNGIETVFDNFTASANFNGNNSTRIGMAWDAATETFFSGTIYSIKVLRNTTDLSLLEDINTNTSTQLINNTKYVLTNGVEEQELYYENVTTDTNIQLINDDDTISFKVDNDVITVNKIDNIIGNNVKLLGGFTGHVKDHIKLYNKAIYENDSVISEFIDTVIPPIEIEDTEIEVNDINIGAYNITGYIEGNPNAICNIVHKQSGVIINSGIGTYNYGSVDYNYINEYEIQEIYNNKIIKRYDIVDMGPPGSIKVFINSKVCTGSNFVIRAYKRDSGVFIGEYELDKTRDQYECTVHNLDTTKTYDIMLFDKNNNVESRVMSNRSPEAY